uniref:Progestin and adipoQ receptor family member 3 n=1 Tax=Ditylenchus dipsaci TaxID=166011 RepID=A0A915EBC4_9BILA
MEWSCVPRIFSSHFIAKMRKRCLHCTYSSYCRQHASFKLVNKNSLKPSMWLNQHIHTSYRPLDLPWWLCVKSIFHWNNETINVWSHLLGFVYLCFMQYWCYTHFLPEIKAVSSDYLVMASSMFCSQICMILSSSYHIFGCQSSTKRRKWLRADLFGISTGLLGIYLSGIYTSFYHFPEVQRLYITTLVGIMAISVSIPLYASKKSEKRLGVVHLVYIALALFGLLPTWHWVQLHGGFSHPHVMQWLPSLVILFSLVGLAFVFYATLLPERLYPGRFDIVGCSHQWWHLIILAAMVYWHKTGILLLTHYHTSDQYMNGDARLGLGESELLFGTKAMGNSTTAF